MSRQERFTRDQVLQQLFSCRQSSAWKMQVYTGKPSGGLPERNLGLRVVLDVTEGLSGRNVTCDNYFTSYELARRLLERNVTVVGTVRKNKPELPLSVKGRAAFSSVFAFTPAATLVSYVPRKKNRNVVLLSTRHSEADVSDRADGKPVVVLDYNRNKGGVDNLDKVIGTYSRRRKTARWPLVVFHNILDVSSYNAFVIWREVNPDWMSGKRNKRRVFLEQLGKALVAPYIARRERVPHTEASAAVVKAVKAANAAAAAAELRDVDSDREDTRHERPAAPPGLTLQQQPQQQQQQQQQPQGPASCVAQVVAAAAASVAAPLAASKRKRCQICPRNKDCKTHAKCRRCDKYICKGCSLFYCPSCAC